VEVRREWQGQSRGVAWRDLKVLTTPNPKSDFFYDFSLTRNRFLFIHGTDSGDSDRQKENQGKRESTVEKRNKLQVVD
jgi:hypothetical protein